MKNCENIKKMLPEYSVGAFSDKKREFIDHHLKNCPECMQELEYLNNVASLMNNISLEEPPDYLWANIKKEISVADENTFLHKSFGWLWEKRIPALVSSFSILLVIASLYFLLLKTFEKTEQNIYRDIGQHTISTWNNPLTDRVALGMIVVKTELGDDKNETNR